MSADPEPAEDRIDGWRVRIAPAPGWRRFTDRRLAQCEVGAPDGTRYVIRIERNWPFARSPLGPFDDLLPQHISLGVLVATNAVVHGRTGWSVQVLRAPTVWRGERLVHRLRMRKADRVASAALALAAAVGRGERPWEESEPWREKARRIMDWD